MKRADLNHHIAAVLPDKNPVARGHYRIALGTIYTTGICHLITNQIDSLGGNCTPINDITIAAGKYHVIRQEIAIGHIQAGSDELAGVDGRAVA